MINSRKAIWADNLRRAHVVSRPQEALGFFFFLSPLTVVCAVRFMLCR